MKFGKSYEEVVEEAAASGGGGGNWLKYFKNGDTTFRIVQEPKDWIGYWEHFNPGGFSFPCTQDRKTCPGCTSDNEKMKKASRKIAIQVLEGEYVNVYKFPKTLADKLSNRAERIGTITDRDYTISRFKSGDKVEYDVEGGEKRPIDLSTLTFNDVEAMLLEAYNDAWGDSSKAQASRDAAEQAEQSDSLKSKLAAAQQREWTEGAPEAKPDWAAAPEPEGKVYTEKELRALDRDQIIKVCSDEGMVPPDGLTTTDEIVDWLLEQS